MNKHFALLVVIAIITILCSCTGKTAKENRSVYIDLQRTEGVEVSNNWGVTKYNKLKLRQDPQEESVIINHLPLGSLVEIIKKENTIKDFDNKFGYWYYIDYKGEVGWIFGTYLETFNTKEEAIKRSEQLLFGYK